MSSENIMPATLDDGPAILNIMEAAVRNLPQRDWFLDDDLDFILRHIDSPQGYTLKYVDEGEVAGFLIVRYPGISEISLGHYLDLPDQELPYVVHMESAGVLPSFRGRKIMYQLLLAAVSREEKAGSKYLMATVHPDNAFSKNNLSAAGFLPIITLKKYGDWVRTVMCRKLNEALSP